MPCGTYSCVGRFVPCGTFSCVGRIRVMWDVSFVNILVWRHSIAECSEDILHCVGGKYHLLNLFLLKLL